MRGFLIGRATLGCGVAQFLETPRQRRTHRFQLVDLLLLAVDGLVQRIDQVVLARKLDFDIDDPVFDCHAFSCHRATRQTPRQGVFYPAASRHGIPITQRYFATLSLAYPLILRMLD
jgi:hypothetical protein